MPFATCDGIETRYELFGSGPPLLLFSPGGFNGTIENWGAFGIYERLRLVDALAERFTCIAFDKRESGQSGGRVELLTWEGYARQGLGLLDELGIEHAHLMGGCIGCSIALTLAVAAPERVDRIVLYSPAGGPRYRRTQTDRFREHADFARAEGLDSVVALGRGSAATFAQDPRVGPWVSMIRRDEAFAAAYAQLDPDEYDGIVAHSAGLFLGEIVPGPRADTLIALGHAALIAPGNDESHALSAAHYLRECVPNAELWDALPEQQTAETAPARVVQFLAGG
jgi:pimeloyl-ACP methyl ester carboxylesterase